MKKQLFTFSKKQMKIIDFIFLYRYNISFDNNENDKRLKMSILYLQSKLYGLKYGNNLFDIETESEHNNKNYQKRKIEKLEEISKDTYMMFISEQGIEVFDEIMEKVFYGTTGKQIEKLFIICDDCNLFIENGYYFNPLDFFKPVSKKLLRENNIPEYFQFDFSKEVINYSKTNLEYFIILRRELDEVKE